VEDAQSSIVSEGRSVDALARDSAPGERSYHPGYHAAPYSTLKSSQPLLWRFRPPFSFDAVSVAINVGHVDATVVTTLDDPDS
jgi:hypothetical protein